MPAQAEFPGETMYPAWLVLATTAMGVLLARRLVAAGYIGSAANWALHCVYAAKVTMLVLPEAGLVGAVCPTPHVRVYACVCAHALCTSHMCVRSVYVCTRVRVQVCAVRVMCVHGCACMCAALLPGCPAPCPAVHLSAAHGCILGACRTPQPPDCSCAHAGQQPHTPGPVACGLLIMAACASHTHPACAGGHAAGCHMRMKSGRHRRSQAQAHTCSPGKAFTHLMHAHERACMPPPSDCRCCPPRCWPCRPPPRFSCRAPSALLRRRCRAAWPPRTTCARGCAGLCGWTCSSPRRWCCRLRARALRCVRRAVVLLLCAWAHACGRTFVCVCMWLCLCACARAYVSHSHVYLCVCVSAATVRPRT